MEGENALEILKLQHEAADHARQLARLRYDVAVLDGERDLLNSVLWRALGALPVEVRDRLTKAIDDLDPPSPRVSLPADEELRYRDRITSARRMLRNAVEVRPYERDPSVPDGGTGNRRTQLEGTAPPPAPASKPPSPPGWLRWAPPWIALLLRGSRHDGG